MLKSCAKNVQSLFVRVPIHCGRVCTFIVRGAVCYRHLVGQVRVIQPSTRFYSTWLYTDICMDFYLLWRSFTHIPQPLLLLRQEI